MITAGTHPPISIDLGSDAPGMTLQREYRDGRHLAWRDVLEDGKVVKSPVDIDKLPFGVYRLISPAPWQHCPFSDSFCRGVFIERAASD